MRPDPDPLITQAAIRERVAEVAGEMRAAFPTEPLTLLAVLKGAVPFAVDLMQTLTGEVELEFVRARSYRGIRSTGGVEISFRPEASLEGRHIVLVEDILDTGNTVRALIDWLDAQRAARITVCTLLDKASRRQGPIEPDFAAFRIDDHFVVGYGMDYDERFRNLPAIHVLHGAEAGDT